MAGSEDQYPEAGGTHLLEIVETTAG